MSIECGAWLLAGARERALEPASAAVAGPQRALEAMLPGLRAGQGVNPGAKALPTNVLGSWRVREAAKVNAAQLLRAFLW